MLLTLFYVWLVSALVNLGFCIGACVETGGGRRPDRVEWGMILVPGANTVIALALASWTLLDWAATLKAKLFG